MKKKYLVTCDYVMAELSGIVEARSKKEALEEFEEIDPYNIQEESKNIMINHKAELIKEIEK